MCFDTGGETEDGAGVAVVVKERGEDEEYGRDGGAVPSGAQAEPGGHHPHASPNHVPGGAWLLQVRGRVAGWVGRHGGQAVYSGTAVIPHQRSTSRTTFPRALFTYYTSPSPRVCLFTFTVHSKAVIPALPRSLGCSGPVGRHSDIMSLYSHMTIPTTVLRRGVRLPRREEERREHSSAKPPGTTDPAKFAAERRSNRQKRVFGKIKPYLTRPGLRAVPSTPPH